MKNIFIIVLCVITHSAVVFASGKTSLSGKITDKQDGSAISGASIYISDLKTGAISKTDGTYKIDNLPQAKVLVQVSCLGYKTIVETVDLSSVTSKDFVMEMSVTEIGGVVITGTSASAEKNKTPTPIAVVTKTQLLQTSSSNIIDAVASQPGVSQVTTGSGISKPVIRGLGYNRVVVVHDGIRQEGQQWGDEHGIEVDEFAVNKVEILKGPASLSYGSDAMAGVINMISDPTLPEGEVKGSALGNYQTNNGLIGYSGNVQGNINGLIWDLRYSGKQAHSFQNKYDGYVYGSGFKENSFGGIIGVNKAWGFSHLHFSTYHLIPGIVEGERDSATGKFIKEFALNDSTAIDTIVPDAEMKTYTLGIPHQEIRHYKAVLNNNFVIGNGNIKSTLGIQQNHRQEFADIFKPDEYGLYFLMTTVNYDVRYIFPEKNNWRTSFGANGMYQQSQNKGSEFLIPEYTIFDIGEFITTKKSYDKLDISGGIRYDMRTENGKDLYLNPNGEPVSAPDSTSYHQFVAFNSKFSAVSGSIGLAYQFSEKVFTKVNVSRGFRAPNIAEISANGVHEGTINYIIGVPTLRAENSLQFDYAIGVNSEHITAEVDLFSNLISDYIFLSKIKSVSGGDSLTGGFSTFKYSSGSANLSGGEIVIDIHPHPFDWLHFENSFSYVQSTQKNQPDSAKYLPFTPAPKFASDLKAEKKKLGKAMANAYIKLGVDNYFKQNKFYSAFGTETATPGYILINAGMGTDFVSKEKTICSLYISVNNLTDVAHQNHLSRLKYGAENYASGRTGVFNMGRNISVKLVVPFDLKKPKA